MKKCKNCGTKQIELPIWKGQEDGLPLAEGNTLGEKIQNFFNEKQWRKIRWYNFIIGDWKKYLIFAMILFFAWSYAHDTEECRDMIEHPCQFVQRNEKACENFGREGIYVSDGYVIELNNSLENVIQS